MKIELCVASTEAILLANKYNFDRIELCQSLETGGITPSIGMQEFALEKFPNTHVLIRPRAGSFVFNSFEIETMLKDITVCSKIGIPGVVIGSLTSDGKIDTQFVQEVKTNFPNLEITFHRAFDDMQNPLEALDTLIEFGVSRILSSGGKASVPEGINQLQNCISHAQGKVEIMIGGGINESNITSILQTIRPDAVHFSGTKSIKSGITSLFEASILEVSETKVEKILSAIRQSTFD